MHRKNSNMKKKESRNNYLLKILLKINWNYSMVRFFMMVDITNKNSIWLIYWKGGREKKLEERILCISMMKSIWIIFMFILMGYPTYYLLLELLLEILLVVTLNRVYCKRKYHTMGLYIQLQNKHILKQIPRKLV